MKTIFTVLILMVSISMAVTAQAPKSGRDARVEQELRSLVRAWDEAYVKGDTAVLDRLLADEFAFVGGQKKADYLASFKSRNLTIESAISNDFQVQVYGDTAVLTAIDTITARNREQLLVTKWLYLDVWIKRAGRWQCVKTYSAPAR
ncbi:MAG TPA: nuclear transport factor 2 family protein [Pyrinomonadaceae bacterium]|nr:nuclear transport factor 2 family protein [Pyrinomonadaceae bacterium]